MIDICIIKHIRIRIIYSKYIIFPDHLIKGCLIGKHHFVKICRSLFPVNITFIRWFKNTNDRTFQSITIRIGKLVNRYYLTNDQIICVHILLCHQNRISSFFYLSVFQIISKCYIDMFLHIRHIVNTEKSSGTEAGRCICPFNKHTDLSA